MGDRKFWAIFTLIFIIATFFILFLIPIYNTPSEYFPKPACRHNLGQIGNSMKIYKIDLGRETEFPKDFGAGFLTTLYRERILVENNIYICPSTLDENENIDLATIRGSDKKHENFISYTGRKNLNQKKYPGIFKPNKDTTTTSISSDDTQGKSNHENGDLMLFLFLDGHVDYRRKNSSAYAKDLSWYLDPVTN